MNKISVGLAVLCGFLFTHPANAATTPQLTCKHSTTIFVWKTGIEGIEGKTYKTSLDPRPKAIVYSLKAPITLPYSVTPNEADFMFEAFFHESPGDDERWISVTVTARKFSPQMAVSPFRLKDGESFTVKLSLLPGVQVKLTNPKDALQDTEVTCELKLK